MFHKKCKAVAEQFERDWAALEKRKQELETLLADIAEVFPQIKQPNDLKLLIFSSYWSSSERPLELLYQVSGLHRAAEHLRKRTEAKEATAADTAAQKTLDLFRSAPKKKP